MGQYRLIVNKDKKEYVDPRKIDGSFKLLEILLNGASMAALTLLLSDANGMGGGDYRGTSNIVGSWAGDRVVVTGDYAEPEEGKRTNLFTTVQDSYRDISEEILRAMIQDGNIAKHYHLEPLPEPPKTLNLPLGCTLVIVDERSLAKGTGDEGEIESAGRVGHTERGYEFQKVKVRMGPPNIKKGLFNTRKSFIRSGGKEVYLSPQPSNIYDPNAHKLMGKLKGEEYFLGYIAKEVAEALCALKEFGDTVQVSKLEVLHAMGLRIDFIVFSNRAAIDSWHGDTEVMLFEDL